MAGSSFRTDLAEYRSLTVFLLYLSLAATLVIAATSSFFNQRHLHSTSGQPTRPPLKRKWLAAVFFSLAVCSLGFTWFYMLSFLAYSHKTWTLTHIGKSQSLTPTNLETLLDFVQLLFTTPTALTPWLKDSVLFREAWEEVVSTHAKYWWSSQIFLITTLWAVVLDIQGRTYRVRNVWLFMVLGQFVAISAGINLFFATLAVSSRSDVAAPSADHKVRNGSVQRQSREAYWTPHWILYTVILGVNLTAVLAIPGTVGTGWFPVALALPHLLLLLPTMFETILPNRLRVLQADSKSVARYYHRVLLTLAAITIMFITVNSWRYFPDFRPLMEALYSHPACSSVGWDVIFCWLSATVYVSLHERRTE